MRETEINDDLKIITEINSVPEDLKNEEFIKSETEKYLSQIVELSQDKKIYLVVTDKKIVSDLSSQISFYGYRVSNFGSLQELKSEVQASFPSLIILDIAVNEITEENKKEIWEIKNLAKNPIPLIFLSVYSDIDTRLSTVRSGGDAFFSKPFEIGKLIDKLDQLTAHSVPDPYRVLVVDDNLFTASFYSILLQQAGMLTTIVTDPFQVMHMIVDFRPDLILLDLYMDGCTGIELASILRQQDAYVGIPIVYLSAEENKERQIEAMKKGADDFFSKSVPPEYIISSVSIRAERARSLRSFMIRDSLTGLINHTQIKESLEIEIARAKRQSAPLTFAMIDLDNFKSINDTYGHLTGDKVIKSLSRLLHQRLRKTDVIGRYGGEEFAVILTSTSPVSAFKVMDNIRHSFSQIRHQTGIRDFSATFSFGISHYPVCKNSSELTDIADKALYVAKRNGKNRGWREENIPHEISI